MNPLFTMGKGLKEFQLCDSRRLRKKLQDAQDDVTELFDLFDAHVYGNQSGTSHSRLDFCIHASNFDANRLACPPWSSSEILATQLAGHLGVSTLGRLLLLFFKGAPLWF